MNNANGYEKARGGIASRASLNLALLPALLGLLLICGCYSFHQGSVAAHLHNIAIPQVEDISPTPLPTVRRDLYDILIKRFRDDNSLRVVDIGNPDSKLEVTITSINREIRRNVSATELETVRGVQVQARATFFDNVKKRAVFKDQALLGEGQYNIAEGKDGEDRALRKAIEDLGTQILNRTISDW